MHSACTDRYRARQWTDRVVLDDVSTVDRRRPDVDSGSRDRRPCRRYAPSQANYTHKSCSKMA